MPVAQWNAESSSYFVHVSPGIFVDGDTLYIFGSARGSDRHPDWFYNLKAHPDIIIEMGTQTIPVRATETVGAEREAVFARQATRFPIFAEYERKTGRKIPVIRLDRRIE